MVVAVVSGMKYIGLRKGTIEANIAVCHIVKHPQAFKA